VDLRRARTIVLARTGVLHHPLWHCALGAVAFHISSERMAARALHKAEVRVFGLANIQDAT
jgi:hypothetical protein